MYVRFTTQEIDRDSGSLLGVIHAAGILENAGALEAYEIDWFREDLAWLNMHLKVPACLDDWENRRAICWFRPHATRPMAKTRSVAALLREHGVPVRMHTCADPGIVVYCDGWQVAAKPRRGRRR